MGGKREWDYPKYLGFFSVERPALAVAGFDKLFILNDFELSALYRTVSPLEDLSTCENKGVALSSAGELLTFTHEGTLVSFATVDDRAPKWAQISYEGKIVLTGDNGTQILSEDGTVERVLTKKKAEALAIAGDYIYLKIASELVIFLFNGTKVGSVPIDLDVIKLIPTDGALWAVGFEKITKFSLLRPEAPKPEFSLRGRFLPHGAGGGLGTLFIPNPHEGEIVILGPSGALSLLPIPEWAGNPTSAAFHEAQGLLAVGTDEGYVLVYSIPLKGVSDPVIEGLIEAKHSVFRPSELIRLSPPPDGSVSQEELAACCR